MSDDVREVIARAICPEGDTCCGKVHECGHDYDYLIEGASRALSALREAGFAVVPAEATEEMTAAKKGACIGMMWPGSSDEANREIDRREWAAMLAAGRLDL